MKELKKFWNGLRKIDKIRYCGMLLWLALAEASIKASEYYPQYKSWVWFAIISTGFIGFIFNREFEAAKRAKNENNDIPK